MSKYALRSFVKLANSLFDTISRLTHAAVFLALV